MTTSEVDASLVGYECFVTIVFAALDGDGAGMVGYVSSIFYLFGDFLLDTYFCK